MALIRLEELALLEDALNEELQRYPATASFVWCRGGAGKVTVAPSGSSRPGSRTMEAQGIAQRRLDLCRPQVGCRPGDGLPCAVRA
ncbi:MAG: hypothetical protein R3D25_13645 [Geminicoccaceae bacterium]